MLDGIRNGFNLVDDNVVPLPAECSNYISATDESVKAIVENQILTEIEQGNYVITEKRPTIISALGAIPKPNSNDVRLIHDCSRPIGTSLNDFATKASVKYQTLDEAINLSTEGCFYAKIDLKSAYRSVNIRPDNFQLTGLKWKFANNSDFTYLVDTRLPFGARKSPAIFHRLTQSVRRMMAKRGFNNIVVYLDDFLIVSPTSEQCRHTMNVLLTLLRRLGFAINWKKVDDPCKDIIFLGTRLNSIDLSVSLPANKLSELYVLLEDFSTRKRASKKQLQSLAGRLNWASRVVRGGRSYLRRVLNTMNAIKLPHHKARLSESFCKDINWWLNYLRVFNGKRMFSYTTICEPVYVDACNTGAGFAFANDWGYINWDCDWPDVSHLHINFKEVMAIVAAARRWGSQWANANVIILTDSECAKSIINKGTTQNENVMKYIRELFWLCETYNFQIECVHIKGSMNSLSDAISRLHEKGRFFQLESLLWDYYNLNLHPLALRYHMSSKTIHALILQIYNWLKQKLSWILR